MTKRHSAPASGALERALERSIEIDRLAGGHVAIEGCTSDALVDIDALQDHPENPKDHDLGAIAESIRLHGLYTAIVVQRATPAGEIRMRIVRGHGTRAAAKQLGYRMLPVQYVVCTDAKARKILAGDNRLTELGGYHKDALAELLTAIASEDDDPEFPGLLGTGYDGDDLDALIKELGDEHLAQAGADEDDELGPERSEVGVAPSDGRLLDLATVTIADPTHEAAKGDVWRLGDRHTLAVVDVFRGWPVYAPLLTSARHVLCPFAGPFVALTQAADDGALVLVQPDAYIAGHILDRYAEVHGPATVRRIAEAPPPEARQDSAEAA